MEKDDSYFLYGYHGVGNFGDDIFLKIFCDRILNNSINSKITFKSGKNKSILDIGRAKKINSPRFLKRLVWGNIFINTLTKNKFVFCAGSLFVSQSFILMYFTLKLLKLFKGEKFKIYAIGVTLGPVSSFINKFFFLRTLKLFETVGVRDKVSLEFYNGSNVIYTNDIALKYILDSKGKHNTLKVDGEKVIGISINNEFYDSPCYITLLDELSNYLKGDEDIVIKLFNSCLDEVDGDKEFCLKLEGDLKVSVPNNVKVINHNPMDVDYFIDEIRTCNKIITARMHVGLVGLLLDIQTLQFGYAPKVKRLFDSIDISPEFLADKYDFEEKIIEILSEKNTNKNNFILSPKLKDQFELCETLYTSISEH